MTMEGMGLNPFLQPGHLAGASDKPLCNPLLNGYMLSNGLSLSKTPTVADVKMGRRMYNGLRRHRYDDAHQ